jgi:hypothetical protein
LSAALSIASFNESSTIGASGGLGEAALVGDGIGSRGEAVA